MSYRHFILHKPFGYLSQFKQNQRKVKKLLGELYDFPEGTMAIGRLDENSEGLLLLTTNGGASEVVRSKKVEKEYFVQLDGIIDQEAIRQLQDGVEIGIRGEKYKTLPCQVKAIPDPGFPPRAKKIRDPKHGPTTWASITVKEGKNRQVRKMTAAVGLPTLRLIRVRIGNIQLADLAAGEVQEIEWFDI